MRVVLIGLSPSVGMQYYTAGLANVLVNEGEHRVWVIGSAALRGNAFDERVGLLPAYSFSGTGLSLPALNLVKLRGLLKQVDGLCPSLVHITGPHLWDLPIALYLQGRYPLVFTVHDSITHQGARGERVKSIFRRTMARAADRVVVHSEAVARELNGWGIRPSAVSIMPLLHHNFDYRLYQSLRAGGSWNISYEDLAILYGRLEVYKGVREFVAAASVLETLGGSNIKMVVAGTGRLSKELKGHECSANLEIRNYLIDDDETIDLFGRAGLLVLPYSEGSQSALIPLAYVFQKPVLVTRVGALPEYVRDGVTGCIIDSNDPMALAWTIQEMISDKEKLVQMGREGGKFLGDLEERFRRSILDAYEAVVTKAPRQPPKNTDTPDGAH